MHDNLGYLFAAFAISWLAIGGYMFYLGQQVRALRDETQMIPDDAVGNAQRQISESL
jgi:CcmD family protein